MQDRNEYIEFADEIEALARDLGRRQVDSRLAVEQILTTTGGRVVALRRAHRHCERDILEEWPADQGLIRAFFYLGAARIRTEGWNRPANDGHKTRS